MTQTSQNPTDPLVKQALLELRRLRAKLEAEQRLRFEPIAVVGIGCRYAGGVDSAAGFFELLCNGVDTIREIPGERWDVDAYYDLDPDVVGKMYTRRGGFLDQVDRFDADFFGISGREAISLDPQQRLLLELAWEALEDAGIPAASLRGGRAGVFVSAMNIDYAQLTNESAALDVHTSTGTMAAVAAGRLAYVLGLHGPALLVDTACSSSLVAVHLACQSLRRRECDLALSGGVNLMLTPHAMLIECATRMLAPDGRCKTFDAAADGFGRGEGGGLVALKRLTDAQADGDNIIAVIRGSAINHDGHSSGLSVPNGMAQEAVIRDALRDARAEPADIDYVEAHGTGTNLGDPIEVGALHGVFGRGRSADKPLLIGSAKTNLGHLEWAAGITGFIKTAMALYREEIPPHINLTTPNPHIDWERLPLRVTTRSHPWPAHGVRMAGVSSFGFSGTNSHVVLEGAPVQARAAVAARGGELLVLSGKTAGALTDQIKNYRAYLTSHAASSLEDVCYTAGVGRSHFAHRLAVVAGDVTELRERLAVLESEPTVAGASRGVVEGVRPKVAFLCTGQGAQYAGMARELYEREPVFRAILDRCAACLQSELERPLLAVMFEPGSGLLDETGYTQPALYALEAGLAALWCAWGIVPDMVMGHSVGEYAAAHIAGVFSLEDGLRLIAARGRLMQALPPGGAMVAVMASAERVQRLLTGTESQLALAAVNGPESVVISGVGTAVDVLCRVLEAESIGTRRLTVSHAFHSPLMEPMLAAFDAVARGITYQAPKIALVSNVSGELAGGTVAAADYWVRHVRAPVRFAAGVRALVKAGVTVCVELGPKPVLLGMARGCVEQASMSWLASLRPGQSDVQSMLESLGGLHVKGAAVDWRGVYAERGYRKIVLPTYPFQRKRFWVKPVAVKRQTTVDPAKTPIINWLEQGDTESLGSFFKTSGIFGDAEQRLMPSVARLLVDRHRRDRGNLAVSDWLYSVEWRERQGVAQAAAMSEDGYWIVLSHSKLGEGLAETLRASHQRCIMVGHGQRYETSEHGSWCIDPLQEAHFERLLDDAQTRFDGPLLGIAQLWPAESATVGEVGVEELTLAQNIGCGGLLHLMQALDRKQVVPKRGVFVVSRGIYHVAGTPEAIDPTHAAISGLGQTIALEYGALWGGIIDLAPLVEADEAGRLWAHMCDPQGEARIALRKDKRYVPRLVRQASGDLRTFSTKPEGSYLITGGTGGLGLRVAQWLVDRGARHIVLVARSACSLQSQEIIARMQEQGAYVAVEQADVTDLRALESVFKKIATSGHRLCGVIHAAGGLGDAVLRELNWEKFSRVMAPKLQGAWNLHRLSTDLTLDFFVLFSSAASVFGAAGQGNYAAGNAFLDGLAHYRRARRLPGLSINWGPWAEVGMAARLDENNRQRMAMRGIGMIDADLGVAVLEHLIAAQQGNVGAPQQAALPVCWSELGRLFSIAPGLSFLDEITELEAVRVESQAQSSESLDRLMAMPSEQRATGILSYLTALAATILKTDANQIAGDADLMDLGIDSLMIMEMLDSIKRDLQLMVYPREVYANPRLENLSAYLATELENLNTEGNLGSPDVSVSTDSSTLSIAEITDPRAGLPEDFQPLGPMVFLLSTPRAGSTLLRVMLAGHPELFSPPELHLLPFTTMAKRHASLKGSYLEQGLQRALMELNAADANDAQALLDDFIDRDIPITEVYALLQKLAGRRLVVDKSPTYALDPLILARAEALFSHAKYIHLVRHPVSSIDSFARLRMDKIMASGAADPYGLAEQIWVDGNRNIDQFMSQLPGDRVHRVKFEDLVAQPGRVLGSLCDFLGIEFDPAVVDPYQGRRMADGVHSHSRPIGDPNFTQHSGIESAKADAWKSIRLPRTLRQDTMRLAGAFDYGVAPVAAPAPGSDLDVTDVPMSERYLEVRGLRLCLCGWGAQDAPLVVLLHGILDQGAAWEQVAVRLVRAGFRVIAPDMRGHGRSSPVGAGGSYSLMDFLADIEVIVDQVTDEPFTLAGHSMGTILAAMYAGIHSARVASLVLVETVLPVNSSYDAGWSQLKTQLKYLTNPPAHTEHADVAAAAQQLRKMTPSLSVEFSERLAARITKSCGDGVCWSWDPLLGTRAGISGGIAADKAGYLQLLGQIPVPTTLLYGNSSGLNRPADVAGLESAMTKARHVTIPGGHQLHIDAATEVAATIAQAATEFSAASKVRSVQSSQE